LTLKLEPSSVENLEYLEVMGRGRAPRNNRKVEIAKEDRRYCPKNKAK
jgi:hypothetical protein